MEFRRSLLILMISKQASKFFIRIIPKQIRTFSELLFCINFQIVLRIIEHFWQEFFCVKEISAQKTKFLATVFPSKNSFFQETCKRNAYLKKLSILEDFGKKKCLVV